MKGMSTSAAPAVKDTLLLRRIEPSVSASLRWMCFQTAMRDASTSGCSAAVSSARTAYTRRRKTHFAERVLNIGVGEACLAAQRFYDGGQALRQGVEHGELVNW